MVGSIQQGRDVGNSLDQSISRVRRQIDEHRAAMKRFDDQVEELVGRRGEALLDLARHYLPEISPAAIQATFQEIRSDLLEVLHRKEQREQQLQTTIDSFTRQIQEQESKLEQVTDQLNEKVAERERLESVLEERLHSSDEFKELSRRAVAAEVELEKNEVRVAEARQEAAQKLPSYEQSRLFKYLHERAYGTENYQKEGITRVLDGWVAKLIGYRRARRGYEFLRVTPELMANEVQRRREHFNVLMEQVEAIEDRNSDEIGLTAVMRAGQELGATRDQLVGDLAKLQDALLADQQELLQLSKPHNKFHEQAIARMRFFLSKMEESKLEQRSRDTPERDDDAIVAEVVWLNDQLDGVQQQESAETRQRQAWDDRLSGLQAVQQRFRAAEFDSRRSMFDPQFDVQQHLARYLAGDIGAEGLWSVIRKHQEFAPARHDQSGPGRGGFGDIINSEMSYVLLRVLSDVAGQALRNAAQRGMERRGPARTRERRQAGRPQLPRPRGGFTKGRGF